jgi:mono/diheme cytochrome c family protein
MTRKAIVSLIALTTGMFLNAETNQMILPKKEPTRAVGKEAVSERSNENWTAPARAARRVNPLSSDSQSATRGRDLYQKECLSCHGRRGEGDGPKAFDLERRPGVLAAPKMRQQSDGELFWKISEGNPPMPAFGARLSEEQRWDIINYIRTLAPNSPDRVSHQERRGLSPTGEPQSSGNR